MFRLDLDRIGISGEVISGDCLGCTICFTSTPVLYVCNVNEIGVSGCAGAQSAGTNVRYRSVQLALGGVLHVVLLCFLKCL